MAQIPVLDNAPINLNSYREQSQKELINILKNIRGKKGLVIDPKLGGSISLIVQTSVLKEHGVELWLLNAEPVQTECTKLVFLVRNELDLMRHICTHIHSDNSKGIQREYFVYFVPRRSVACEKILDEEKVHQLLTIGEWPLYMIPLDEDVLSFELDFAYKECLVDGDTSSLWHIAKAIHKLEFSTGVIPNVRAKGRASVRVAEILNSLQTEEPVNTADMNVPEINTVILLDREVDMVTPMLSQLTYEGLLDEFLHIENGAVEVDASIMGAQQEGKKAKVPLNSSDKLFKEIRDLNFEVVVQVLRQKATSMKQDYTDITTMNQSVSELKDFVKKLNSLPEITRHINLAQHLTTFTSKPSFLGRLDMEQTLVECESYDICFEYIEEMIFKQEPFLKVLRLLIIFSVTNLGLPKKQFDYLRREILHSYGFEHMATLNNLEKAGLFKKQETRSNYWQAVKNALHLVVEDTDTANPNDVAYVYSGYAPLSIRLIQHAIRSGWRPIEEILKLLPGPHYEAKRAGFSRVQSYDSLSGGSSQTENVADSRRAVVLVVFIGGVTFTEIAALRFLSGREGMAYDIIVATTKVINGHTLVDTFVNKLT